MLVRLNLFLILLIISSCGQLDPQESTSNLFVNRGDIIVTSSNADDIAAIDRTGRSMRVLTGLDRTSQRVTGVTWSPSRGELLMAIDGTDRIEAMNGVDGSSRILITNAQLTGTLRGIAELTNGDIIISETNNIEKFNKNGSRITTGFPVAINTPYQLRAIPGGGFIVCAGGTADRISVYNNAGVQQATHAGPGGHDAIGCDITQDGKVLVVWSGTTDQIWLYPDLTLTGGSKLVDNTTLVLMPTPTGLAVTLDNTILVTDSTYHNILEISMTGDLLKTFAIVGSPSDITVIK